MSGSESSQTKSAGHRPRFDSILTIVSEKNRWLILRELMKGKPLPVSELSKRTGLSRVNTSKHAVSMERRGFLIRGFGGLYEIPAHFLVPGENVLDFGAVVLRFDHLPS
jgi:DNA-binding IclR family transcriptional regulator